jgi:glycosyltransferase involved in cell wall biosynthesis
MKVLLNTTTLFEGGALQLGTSMVREALKDSSGIQWQFATSRAIANELRRFCPDAMGQTDVYDDSPAVNRLARRRLVELEARLRPDCVFTAYGPAYVEFAAPHLCGAASPWVAHADFSAYRVMKFPGEWLRVFFLTIYRGYWFRHADFLAVETEYVRQGYHKRLGFPLDRIAVVSNTCGQHYLDNQGRRPFPSPHERLRILCFAAPYKHKRLESIPDVASQLAVRRPELDFEFVTTLNPDNPVWHGISARAAAKGVAERVRNLGRIPVADGPELYQSCHICFMPTVLECFSATYPEAMAMGLPIVTTDLGFVRDVCREAALYYRPFDPAGAADRIVQLLDNEPLWEELIDHGKRVLQGLPTAHEKYLQYVELVRMLVGSDNPGAMRQLETHRPKTV